MKFKTKFTEADTEDYKTWVTFYPKRNSYSPFRVKIEGQGYFDPRPQFQSNITSLLAVILPFFSLWFLPLSILFLFVGWGDIYLRLPFDTGKGNESESPEYTVMTYCHNKFVTELWVVWGKYRKHIELPWAYQWVRTSTLLKNNSWFHENSKKRYNWDNKEVGSHDWLKEAKWQEVHHYIDKYDSTVVNATLSVVEREWRPKWFKWTNLFSKTVRVLDIEFDQEVGNRKGSWKGGTIGCSYNLLPNESPLECLRRMEREREF